MSKDRRVRALIEFDIVIPEHEKDERKFIERCFTGTRLKIVEIRKPPTGGYQPTSSTLDPDNPPQSGSGVPGK